MILAYFHTSFVFLESLLMAKHKILVTLRIPGTWPTPADLFAAMPAGCKMQADRLILSDGTEIEVNIRPRDAQFVSVFGQACRRGPTKAEKAALQKYTWQICLTGPGGSMHNAVVMMQAAAAVLQAGGSGVFIDNSAMSFGAEAWHEMVKFQDTDAISYAFTSIARDPQVTYTIGMHVFGLPNLEMRNADTGPDGDELIELIQWICNREKPCETGQLISTPSGSLFRVSIQPDKRFPPQAPMHNPWGTIRFTSTKEISERN